MGYAKSFTLATVGGAFVFALTDLMSSLSVLDVKVVPSPPLSKLTTNPMFSVEPLKHSLHSKWKLWDEMSTLEQKEAMKEAGSYIKKYGGLIMKAGRNNKSVRHGTCDLDKNIGSTGHKLCLPNPIPDPCTFISFGINDDPSYDRELATYWKCRGFAADPTVHHPSKLHDLVTFHNIGATILMNNEEREIDKGGTEEWWFTSMPKLRAFLGLDRINVLKLDCEGCEVALSRDILREDPSFLQHVDQINLETHVTRTWINSTEHAYYFGLHFALLEEAGFDLEWSSVFGCSKRHEITGCVPEMEEYEFPCGYLAAAVAAASASVAREEHAGGGALGDGPVEGSAGPLLVEGAGQGLGHLGLDGSVRSVR